MGHLILLGLVVAPVALVGVCIASGHAGGWKQIVRVMLAMAATVFQTWFVCDFRLRIWKSNQTMHNRWNVCSLHDNLTALIDIGDEKLAREYVEDFYTNGCELLNFEQMRLERNKELLERHLDWYMRIQELKGKSKEK